MERSLLGSEPMSVSKRLTEVFNYADVIPYDNHSKFVLMSDCHRGDGSQKDSFLNNQNLFFAALSYYYEKNFTYIELGDGDELWENRKMDGIITVHSNAFWLMSKFYEQNRLYMIYGNHDKIKANKQFRSNNLHSFYDEGQKKSFPLLPKIHMNEGLILENKDAGHRIHLAHGHQGDFLNDTLWRLARFLVRFIWGPLELISFKDPTSAAKNYDKKEIIERKLSHWADSNGKMLIAGHTHRPVFPRPGDSLYFNEGSCVHPRCITAIEISDGMISLVKWSIQTRKDRSLFVDKEILAGPENLINYFCL